MGVDLSKTGYSPKKLDPALRADGSLPVIQNLPQEEVIPGSGLVQSVTYILYSILLLTFVIGGAAYLVFWKEASAFWSVVVSLIILEAAHYTPAQWTDLFYRNPNRVNNEDD